MEEDIESKLGTAVYEKILDESYNVTPTAKMVEFAYRLGGRDVKVCNKLRAGHIQRTEVGSSLRLEDYMREILKEWFKLEAYAMSQEDAVQRVIQTFKHRDVDLGQQAHQLEQLKGR